MRDFSTDHRWLSINTATVRKSRGVEQPLTDIIEACAQRGIQAISPWRDQVAAAGLPAISTLVKTHGLQLSGYCRGGMFPAVDAAGLKAALAALAKGDLATFHAILAPTVPLSRHIFQAPTRFYKTGVVFMAWLNGHQKHFSMVGGQQSTRSMQHLAELFRLADAANLLEQPEMAVRRMKTLLALHGVQD